MPDSSSEINKLVEHFFRHESGKMISVLTGILGAENLILAEDLVQDTIIEAISTWTYKGIPKNHVAWLYTVARNKTLNALKREKYRDRYILECSHLSIEKQKIELQTEDLFSDDGISDDQLRMMFMCCHQSISKDSQVALILKTICGFNISEIAKCYLTSNQNINKRLVRARKKIRLDKISFEVPKNQDLDHKLDAVLEAIYLLFNEGYSASTGMELIRIDLCTEAIRLAEIVVNHKSITHKTNAYALIALMQLNSSRFNAREDENGNMLTLSQQNRSLWDLHIMEKGISNLARSTQSGHISRYHILASISSYHCTAKDFDSTDWNSILILYDKLLSIDNSPIVILNRAIILSKVSSTEKAFQEIEKIKNEKSIEAYHLFYSTKSEFHVKLQEYGLAKKALKKAIELAPLLKEKQMLESRYQELFNKNQ